MVEIDLIQITSTKGIIEGMKTSRQKDHIEDIAKKIFKWGHWSVLEHCSMTVRISEITRACTHQLVRHRIGNSYTQESQRYFDPLEEPKWFVIPPRIEKNPELKKQYIHARKEEAEEYRYYREKGIPKEDARFILPGATTTQLIVSMNAHSLIDFFVQRLCVRSQWEIRELAELMLEEVKKVSPLIFKDLGAYCDFYGYCPENDLSCGRIPTLDELKTNNK